MTSAPFDPTTIAPLLPADVVGTVLSASPIRVGLSGAGVYAVTTDRGAYILRVQSAAASDLAWTQHRAVLERAATAGVAPAVVHVDERARAMVSTRVEGMPLPHALGDPSQRDAAVASVVAQLRTLHALDAAGVREIDGVQYARATLREQQQRQGFPAWTDSLPSALDDIAGALARDTRRVVSHNDVNPGNVVWDGRKAWLVDWEVAALGHPYYDVATFTTFLNLDLAPALGLLAMHEQRALDEWDRAIFAQLRRLVAIALGATFLRLASDLEPYAVASRDAAPTLGDVYAGMRAGTLDLQTARGQAAFGLAFLRIATAAP